MPSVTPSSVCSPIFSLPTELISAVFEVVVLEWELQATLSVFRDKDGLRAHELIAFLRSITAVCHLWREVAFGTPRLWRNVFGHRSSFLYGTTWSSAVDFSGAVPLVVWGHSGFNTVGTLIRLATAHRHLQVRSVHVHGLPLRLFPFPVTLHTGASWSSLRALNLYASYGTSFLRSFLAFMQGSTSLVELRLSSFVALREDVVSPPISMLALRRLIVDYRKKEEVNRIFTSLRFPALQDLSLIKITIPGVRASDRGSLLDAFGPLVEGSGTGGGSFASLRVLSLGGSLSSDDAISVIVRLPHIHCVRLFDIKGDRYLHDILGAMLYGGCLPLVRAIYIELGDLKRAVYEADIALIFNQAQECARRFDTVALTTPPCPLSVQQSQATPPITTWSSPTLDIRGPLDGWSPPQSSNLVSFTR